MFYNILTKTLYTTNQVRVDTCTAVAFLTTRVRYHNKHYWGKLVHLMKYIMGTKYLSLVLSANGSGVLKLWVDAYYAVHPNIRVHTCGGRSMGRVFNIVTLTNRKLNTRSST